MYQENTGGGFDGPMMSNPDFSMDGGHHDAAAISAMEMELQNQLNIEMDHCYNTTNNEIQQIVQEMSSSFNGPSSNYDLHNYFPNPSIIDYKSSTFLASLGLYGGGDLVNHRPPDVAYDPLNLPPQPPLLRDLFHNIPPPPGGYNGNNNINGCGLFDDQRPESAAGTTFFYQNNNNENNGIFEFSADGEMDCLGKNNNNINININNIGKDGKQFPNTERHRRVLLHDKFQALRALLANPTKNDRASIVGDAINYINELKRSVGELNLLVEKKRCAKERMKRLKTEGESAMINGDQSSKSVVDMDHHTCNGSTLRSSWLHRKSKNTEVDVRIIDDEVTVKLVQQKRINCLLFVSKVLDELQLDLHHVAGGLIGDYYSFLFNSKICEGSIVYASAIANKLIEVVDKHYAAAIPQTNSY